MALGASFRSRSESPLMSNSSGIGFQYPASVPSYPSSEAPRMDYETSGCALFSAQAARKRVEQDSILLANRIRLLKAEEEKTRKKTVETEKKVREIVAVQRRNEEQRARREALEAQREAEERELRSQNIGLREEQQRKIEQKQRMLMQANSEASSSVRQSREEGARRIQQERELALAAVAAKADKVRRSESKASRSRARSEGAKQDLAQQAVRERVLREDESRRLRLKEVEDMEREEAALMAKLAHSQERHRAAFMQLEDVLRSGAGGTQPSTPSGTGRRSTPSLSGSAAALAAASNAAATLAGASSDSQRRRPPRPRAPPSAAHSLRAPGSASQASRSPASASPAASSAPSPACASPLAASPVAVSLAEASPIAALRSMPGGHLAAEGKPADDANLAPRCPSQAMSSCSTSSGIESGLGNTGSGQSTPCSVAAAAPTITYTTVDGTQLEIPEEEDLDLAELLNS